MEDFNLITFLLSLLGVGAGGAAPEIWNIVAQVVTLATGITMWLKSTSDNAAWDIILKVLKYLSGNVLNNTNADDA